MYQNIPKGGYAAKSIIACFYSYLDSHILIGHVNPDKKVMIESSFFYKETLPDVIGKRILQEQKPIWINKSTSLKRNLNNRCNELDFDIANESEIQELEGLFAGLKKTERIVTVGDCTLKNSDACINSMKILLRGLSDDLWSGNTSYSRIIAGGTPLKNPFA